MREPYCNDSSVRAMSARLCNGSSFRAIFARRRLIFCTSLMLFRCSVGLSFDGSLFLRNVSTFSYWASTRFRKLIASAHFCCSFMVYEPVNPSPFDKTWALGSVSEHVAADPPDCNYAFASIHPTGGQGRCLFFRVGVAH